jgi:hypothetical protein
VQPIQELKKRGVHRLSARHATQPPPRTNPHPPDVFFLQTCRQQEGWVCDGGATAEAAEQVAGARDGARQL